MFRLLILILCCQLPLAQAVAQLPPPPNPVTVTPSCTSIRLSWSPVAQAVDYYIRRNTVNNQNTATTVACHQPNFYVDSSVAVGTTYFYWVGSNNGVGGCGNGPPGSTVQGTLLTLPGTPGGVSASSGLCGSVTVVWTPLASGATGYGIYRNTSSATASATRIGTAVTSPFQDTTAQAGTSYFYWVKADNTCGSSPFSAGAAGGAAPNPGTPTSVAASDATSCTTITVSWVAAANATNYGIYRNTQNSATGRALLAMAAGSPYVDTTAQRGTTCFYWVRGVNSCGNGAFSTPDGGSIGTCGAVAGYGSGCGAPALVVGAAGSSRPVLGQTFVATVGNVPAGIALMAMGFSNTTAGAAFLPLALDGLGLTGCFLLQSAESIAGACTPTVIGQAQHSLPIPGTAAFLGARVYLQAWAAAPGQNPAGIVVSNGLALTVGNL